MSLQFDSDSDSDDGMSDILREVAALQEKVFHNENILEQIFQFMSIEDLASTRLVCKKWKSESDRILRIRQPLIVLRTKTDIQRITELLDKGRTLSSVPVFKNFLILFDQIHLEQEEVAEFLNNHGSSFEQLSIQFDWHLPATQNTPQSFKYLLEKQVPNLKSIFFFGFSEELWQSGELFNDSVNLLPNLKHIGCITVNNYRHAWECPLYLSLFNRLSSVKKITINCSNYWDILFTQAETSNDNQLRRFFSNVEEINTGFYDDKILARVRLVEDRQPINVPNVLKSLPQLCPKVKILRLWFNSHNIYNRHVGGVLGKYAEQLEVLWLNVVNYKYTEEEIEDVEMEANPTYLINDLLASSAFKKLRVLRTSIDILQPPNAVTQFFHQQLPALESLSLLYKMSLLAWNPDFKYSRLRKLELLVGNPEHLEPIGQAFPNLKILNIKLNGNAVMQAVPRVFPNLEELYVACYTRHLTNIGIACVQNMRQLRLLIMEDFGENYIGFLKNIQFSPFAHLPFVPPLKVPAELLNRMKAQNRLVRPVT